MERLYVEKYWPQTTYPVSAKSIVNLVVGELVQHVDFGFFLCPSTVLVIGDAKMNAAMSG